MQINTQHKHITIEEKVAKEYIAELIQNVKKQLSISEQQLAQTKYGFNTQAQEDKVIQNIIEENTQEQDGLVKRTKYSTPAKRNTTPSSPTQLRDVAKKTQSVFKIDATTPNGYIKTQGKKPAGNDEFFQTSQWEAYYSDKKHSAFRNSTFSSKDIFLDFRQGTNTFQHGEGAHTGHKYSTLNQMQQNKGQLTNGTNIYHKTRDEAIYRNNGTHGSITSPKKGIQNALLSHLSQTDNCDKILQSSQQFYTSSGFVLPNDKQDYARNMQLNRDKIKIVRKALQFPTQQLSKDDFHSASSLSPIKDTTPISRNYTQDIIKRANKSQTFTELANLARERAPIVRT